MQRKGFVLQVHWFRDVERLSSVRKDVFNCFLKVVMASAVQVDLSSSFHQRGAERVKVLESHFVPRCEGIKKC